jgi:hypothetical protein
VATVLAASMIFTLTPGQLRGDDFGKIVHKIEASYHVHRNYRFLMGFARVVVVCTGHFTGLKGFKMALFEDQHLLSANPDSGLDDVVQSAGEHGWQSIVKSYSRRGNEHAHIYARPEGKDLKLLIVSVESNEAVVVQVKINPAKLARFMDEHDVGGHHPGEEHDDAGPVPKAMALR